MEAQADYYRFRPGDVVTVRRDLKLNNNYWMDGYKNSDSFVEGMSGLLGKRVTIKAINNAGKYNIRECGFNWTDGMFEEYFCDQDEWTESTLNPIDDLFD